MHESYSDESVCGAVPSHAFWTPVVYTFRHLLCGRISRGHRKEGGQHTTKQKEFFVTMKKQSSYLCDRPSVGDS